MEKFPNDFPSDRIKKAKRQGRLFWEQAGIDGMMGKIKGFNAKVWGFNFKNRFGWKENPEMANDEKIIINFGMERSQFVGPHVAKAKEKERQARIAAES